MLEITGFAVGAGSVVSPAACTCGSCQCECDCRSPMCPCHCNEPTTTAAVSTELALDIYFQVTAAVAGGVGSSNRSSSATTAQG